MSSDSVTLAKGGCDGTFRFDGFRVVGDRAAASDEGSGREAGRRSAGVERDILATADGGAVGGHSGALRTAYDLCEPLQPLAQGRPLGADIAGRISGL